MSSFKLDTETYPNDVNIKATGTGETSSPFLLQVGGSMDKIYNTPTLSNAAAYHANDYVGFSGTAMTFECARVDGGTGLIIGATLVDLAHQNNPMELWLFDASVTPPADNGAWSISDSDIVKCIGVIPFSSYYASALNSVCNGVIPNGQIPFKADAESVNLYGCLVTRGTPTYASGDLTITLTVAQD